MQCALTAALAAALLSAAAQTPALEPTQLAKANDGDPAAQVAVGEWYAARAAEQRNEEQAGELYRLSEGWYRKAADNLYIVGEMKLAQLYRDGGKGFPRQMEQAAVWYRKAAEQGEVTAQGILGVLYSIGQGLPQDYVEAYFWLDLAASANGPNQEKYIANRQLVGTHLTAGELETIEERVAAWLAAHPRPSAPEHPDTMI
jgi:TPR repeat protein